MSLAIRRATARPSSFCSAMLCTLLVGGAAASQVAHAQATTPSAARPAPATAAVVAAPAAVAEKKPPPREDVSLPTADGVVIQAGYYGSLAGKNAVPVILLHMHKGAASDYDGLADALQAAGHAVIVPDLRGHGRSTVQDFNNGRRLLEAAQLRKGDYEAMVRGDLEAVKKFLVAKNNAGELNIEKLCVVGAEMGAVVALNWAAWDWHWPPLTSGKQGQDVKALVLISPPWSFKGLTVATGLTQPEELSRLSILIAFGGHDPAALGDARRLQKLLEKYHPTPPVEEAEEKQTLFFDEEPTSLQGTKILNEKSLSLTQNILLFIKLRLEKKSYPWAARAVPGQ